jgi:N-acylneuraminate cytidylyltransferase
VSTAAVRENMHNLMLQTPLKRGLEHVKRIILGEDNIEHNY